MKLKNTFLLIAFLLSLTFASAQSNPITGTPAFPSENDQVELIFDAAQGNGGLAGYPGDVYAHTGVLTDASTGPSDWRHVKTNWGQNTPATKLERIGTDLYKLVISPSIRAYYNVPQNEMIQKMAFVFRSGVQVDGNWLEGKTENGGDIFYEVYPEGLFAKFINPDSYSVLTTPGSEIEVAAISNRADSLFLYMNDLLIKSVAGNTLNHSINAGNNGKHYVRLKAKHLMETAVDSFYFYVKQVVNVQDLPQGIADGINVLDDNTVVLSLYAPEKQDVFVFGDFNNWEYDDAGYMNRTPDGKRYWKQLNNLEAGREYIFQYLVDGSIRIGDPYAEKVSDPWNDKYISESTYPGILPYPAGKAQGIATVLQTQQEEYNWQVSNFEKPAKTDLVIYELLVRDFIAKHDYRTLIDTLSYLKRLGINAIELMPVNEFEGNSSWGYNPNYYFAPDKYYGHKNDLKAFIDECHKAGIAVIIDMVLNHSFGTSPMVMLYWDAANNRPAANNPWFNPVAKHDYNVGFDFNHESPQTKALVNRVVKFWLEEYRIDGYRFDLSKGFTQKNTLGDVNAWGKYDASRVAIWKNISDTIWSVNPETYVILEHFAENSEEKVLANYGMMLWASGTYNKYMEAAMGYNNGSNSNFSSASYLDRGWDSPHLVAYMESHDEERMVYKNIKFGNSEVPWYNLKDSTRAFERAGLAASFFYTIPGPKMLWQFGELGYDYSIDFNGRTGEKPIRWDYTIDYRRQSLYNITKALIELKTGYEVFQTDDFTLSLNGPLKKIVLRHSSMDAVVAGNFDINSGSIQPDFTRTGFWYEYFTGDSIQVNAIDTSIDLKAGEYRIYTTKKITTPQTGLGITTPAGENPVISIPYPNPSSGQVTIPIYIEKESRVEIELFDLTGRAKGKVFSGQLIRGNNDVVLRLGDLNIQSNGLYLLRITAGSFVKTHRLLLK